MFVEQTAEVAGRHAQAPGEIDLLGAVERAVDDHLHASAHEFGPTPVRRRRGAIGTATETGPEAGGLCGRGEIERADIVGTRPPGTTGSAVDAGRYDCREGVHDARYIALASS